MPPRAPETPAGAALPPGAVRPVTPGAATATAKAPSTATSVLPPRYQPLWSSEPAGGATMPAHVPPAPPRLAINLSPEAATRALSMLGLGVALLSTVATTLAVIAVSPGGLPDPRRRSRFLKQLTNWLVSVPWLFVAVVGRRHRASNASSWPTLPGLGDACPLAAAACAAMQVVNRDLVSTWTLATRACSIVVATVSLSLAFRQFLAGRSKTVPALIVGGAFAGLLGGLGTVRDARPLHRRRRRGHLRADRRAARRRRTAPLALVLATVTIRATLVYVRDFLPDFNIALETAA